MQTETFVVDASLLLELGERLIGRPEIALGELIKNAFDADAYKCEIQFGTDEIVISDNGDGMSERDFHAFWMRIGTTHKVDERVSARFKRPLTGSKGIGRLAVQFLAGELTLESNSRLAGHPGVYAKVDWTTAVSGAELSSVKVRWEAQSRSNVYPDNNAHGTRLTLRRLKNEWDATGLEVLGKDIWMLRSPFKAPSQQRSSRRNEFEVEIEAPGIEGAQEAFNRTLDIVFSNWKARVWGALDDGRSGGTATVFLEFKRDYPKGSGRKRSFQTTVSIPVRGNDSQEPQLDHASFEILVFKPQGRQPGGVTVGDLRKYLGDFGNVSLYDAGFRLPYYGSKREELGGEDWLSIAVDQGRRLSQSELLPPHLQTSNKYLLDLPAPGRIFGAVEIDTNHERRVAQRKDADGAVYLQIQPGRDRLHDNAAFHQLKDLVRFGLDFYANRFRLLSLEAVERQRSTEPASKKYSRAIEALESSKKAIPTSVFKTVRRELTEAAHASKIEERTLDQRAALLAPLASAGMTALALNHEISRESSFLDRISVRLRRLAAEHGIKELSGIADEFRTAKQRLDSLRELFAPLLSDSDKAATDRLRVAVVVDQATRGMRVLMPGVNFRKPSIPSDLRFPLGALAEWNAILQNVLSNSWNAMLDATERRIAIIGERDLRGVEWLRISDTGQGLSLPLSESATLFEPFERRMKISADKRSIAIGGQGLGLAIVRMIATRRGAAVAFVEPEEGFSTTFQISWRSAK